jgi:hypothetical protein
VTTDKKHNTCACKKAMTAGRKQRMHAEKEDLMTVELGFSVRSFL